MGSGCCLGWGRRRRLTDCHVYDTASGRETVTYRGHDNIVIATAISPDGRWAATGGGNNEEIHIWDLATAERRKGPDGQPLTLGGRGTAGLGRGLFGGWAADWVGEQLAALVDPQRSRPARICPDAARGRCAAHRAGFYRRGGLPPRQWPSKTAGRSSTARAAIMAATPSSTSNRADGWSPPSSATPPMAIEHRAYTFTPDGETIISGGSNGVLTAYDLRGQQDRRIHGP